MMYSCAPGSRSSVRTVKKKGKSKRIDLHCHYLNPEVAARMAQRNPGQYDPEPETVALFREVRADLEARPVPAAPPAPRATALVGGVPGAPPAGDDGGPGGAGRER